MAADPAAAPALFDLPLYPVTWGGFNYTITFGFAFCLLLGALVLFFFSSEKFGQSTLVIDENDLLTRLLPRYLATQRTYSRAFALYVFLMLCLLVSISVLGPKALGFKAAEAAPATLPLLAALVLVGLMPKVPMLQTIE